MSADSDVVCIPKDEYRRLIEKLHNLKRQMQFKDEALNRKNVELDALHMVWCDGACYSGVHRYEDGPVTEEMVTFAERNTTRLRRWFDNAKWKAENWPNLPTTQSEWHRQHLARLATKVEPSGQIGASE